MKNLFKRKIGKSEAALVGNTPFNKVFNFINAQQRKWANWLQIKSDKLPLKFKWAILLIFFATTFCICLFLFAGKLSFRSRSNPIAISRIKQPVTLNDFQPLANGMSKTEYEKITGYRIYLDSLARSPEGRAEYQKVLKQHPGLQDSIKILEQLYQSQFKN